MTCSYVRACAQPAAAASLSQRAAVAAGENRYTVAFYSS